MFKVVNIDQTFFDNLSKTRFAGSPFQAHRRLVLRPAELFHISDRSSVLSYKSAFVLVHKLREAMAEELKGRVVGGEGKQTEVDGGYFGGYVKPSNQTEYRRDRRLARNQNGKRKVVVVIRERGGNSVPAVFNTESQAASFIHGRIAKGTIVHADEAAPWDNLHERFGGQENQSSGDIQPQRRLH